MVEGETNMNMNDIIVKSIKNLDEFYKEVKSLFNTIIVDLGNNHNYAQLKNSPIVHEGSRSLVYPHLWFPYYLSQIFQEKEEKQNYIVVSIVFRALFGDNKKTSPPLSEIPIIFGKYINCTIEGYLKWYNKDIVFSDDVKIKNAKKGNPENVIDKISDYGFDKGFIYKRPLFQCYDAHELVKTAMEELKSLETMSHIRSKGK